MKITGYRGPAQIPPIRTSGGIYAYPRADGTWIYAKKPDQPALNDDASQCNRDQLTYSSFLVNIAIPLEVAGALAWSVNSNDTYKDALTRGNYGTLSRLIGPAGEQYYPADHSCGTPPPEPGPTSMAWEMLAQLTGAWAPATTLDAVIPSGITEVMIVAERITGTVASTLGVRIGIGSTPTYKSGAADYKNWPTGGVAVNNSFVQVTNAATANFQSGIVWIPNTNWGDKKVLMINPTYGGFSGMYVGTTDPVTAVRLFRTAGSLSGDASSYAFIMGR